MPESTLPDHEWQSACATATMDGFGHAWLDVLTEDVNTLTLRAGHRLRVRCVLRDGSPLPGVRLGLSLSPQDRNSDLVDGLPQGSPLASVHVATTGDDGRCTLVGLQPDDYMVAIEHPWAMLRSRLKQGAYLEVGSDAETELVFEEPLVSAYALQSRPTLRWFIPPSRRMRGPPPGNAQYGGLLLRLRKQAAAVGLADSLHTHIVTADDQLIGKSMDVSYYAPGEGWVLSSIPFRPASQCELVVVDPANARRCAERGVIIQCVAPDGQPSTLTSVQLELVDLKEPAACQVERPRRFLFWTVASGKRLVVPCGSYRIKSDYSVYGYESNRDGVVKVEPGQGDLVVNIKEGKRMARVRLDAMTPEGAMLSFFHLRAISRSDSATYNHTYSVGARDLWLPIGDYRFEIHLPGFEVGRFDSKLEDVAGSSCEEVVVLTRAR